MIQWPGVSFKDQDSNILWKSDSIEDSMLSLVELDAQTLKKLKEENNGKLHLVGF